MIFPAVCISITDKHPPVRLSAAITLPSSVSSSSAMMKLPRRFRTDSATGASLFSNILSSSPLIVSLTSSCGNEIESPAFATCRQESLRRLQAIDRHGIRKPEYMETFDQRDLFEAAHFLQPWDHLFPDHFSHFVRHTRGEKEPRAADGYGKPASGTDRVVNKFRPFSSIACLRLFSGILRPRAVYQASI